MFRTSRPCAVTTSGASTDEAIRPAGTRKCAQTTSGRRRRAHLPPQLEEPPLPAGAPVEHRELDLVPALAERHARAGATNDAEVGVVRPRVHLRDEEDPQRAPLDRLDRVADPHGPGLLDDRRRRAKQIDAVARRWPR